MLTLPLRPSVKWDHVLPCLPHRAMVRESVRSYPNTSSHQKGDHTGEASWEGGVGDDKVEGGTFIPIGSRTFISFSVGASIPSPVK